ncbi:MAG: pyridoxine 5'-phosphate synthase [Deltaproteobacteria bacterium]|nr:pyridoxine 5'-phosphate synthase [Deltaproteobacteria bacterium]
MPTLTVNVDHVATVRQARRHVEPDPVVAAAMAELGGADGITVHLREDRRHIQDRDLEVLRKTVKTRLNLEMAATKEMLDIAVKTKPDMVTIVPEKRQELTTEGGLDLRLNTDNMKTYVTALKDAGISVNLFIDPVPEAIKASHRVGANGIELHTGKYAELKLDADKVVEFKRLHEAAVTAKRMNLKVHAGHGLDYINIKEIAAIREIEEYAIGFSIVARSIYVGMEEAVREMKRLIREHGA